MPIHEGKGKKPGQLFVLPKEELKGFRALTPEEAARFREKNKGKKKQPEAETKEGAVTLERAAELMGQDYLGPDAVEATFGVQLESHEIPPIPFTEAELERAKELGQFLILRVDHAPDGEPLTMQKMDALLERKFAQAGKGAVLYLPTDEWKTQSAFFTTETPRLSWALTGKALIPDSTIKNYLEQTKLLVKYVEDEVYKQETIPESYQEALDEFQHYHDQNFKGKKKEEIKALLSKSGWKKYAAELGDLKINQLFRQSPVEALYDLLVYFEHTGKRMLELEHTWTSRRSADGHLVYVGFFVAYGAGVYGWRPDYVGDDLGVSFSRSLK